MSYRQFVKKFTITMDDYKSESSYLPYYRLDR